MSFEVAAGRVQHTPSGLRVGPFHVVTVAAPEGPQVYVSVLKDGEGPVKGVSYSAGLGDDPLTIAYAVATFLGFMLDDEAKDAS